MRFSGNAPPTGWPVVYSSILDLDRFAIELALAAAIKINGHNMAAKQLLHFTLLLQLSPAAAQGPSCIQKRLATQGA